MKDNSRFYSSLGLLVFLNAIIKPAWIFAIDRQVQNEVGVHDYGVYFSLLNLSIVVSFLLDLGITNYYNRQLASNENLAINPGSLIWLKLIFAILYAAVISIIAFLTGIGNWNIIVSVIAIQMLTSFFVFFRAIITGQQWFRTDAWLSVLDKGLMIIFCGLLIYFPLIAGNISINRFLFLQIISTSLAIAVAVAILYKRKFHFSSKFEWPSRSIFRASLPFALIILLMAFHARIDGFLLERLSGPSEAGIYAGAYRLLDAANMTGYLIASFLLPYIARHWKQTEMASNVILNVRHLLLLFAITLVCIVIFLAPWIQNILYHHSDPHSIRVLQFCVPAFIGYSLVHIYGTVLTATGHLRAFTIITLCSVIINIALNLILIPSKGAIGSCIAAIASQSFSGLATLWYSTVRLKFRIGERSILIYIFITAVVCAFLYAARQQSPWIQAPAAFGLVVLSMWLTKLVRFRSWFMRTFVERT